MAAGPEHNPGEVPGDSEKSLPATGPAGKPGSKKKSSHSPYIRFSSMAIQMGLLIGLGAWGGTELDERAGNKKPIYTIILCLLAIAVSLYLVIREASKLSKDDK